MSVLEPLRPDHAPLLAPYADDMDIWPWMPTPTPGAHLDGVLRHHDQWWTGHARDAMVWSILRHEWPDVRERLERRMA